MRPFARCLVLSFWTVLFACGEPSAPPPPAELQATPTPTRTPTPPRIPVTLHRVVFDEQIAAPPGLAMSPLDRALVDVPAGRVSAAFLREDGAPEGLVVTVEGLEAGEGEAGAQLALIEWRLAWGEDGSAGRARRWGLCSLPCAVDDTFVATRSHHPVDPVDDPLVLFAGRPGAVGPTLRWVGEEVVVEHGGVRLWPGGAAVDEARSEAVPLLEADGVSEETTTWDQRRRLTAAVLSGITYPVPTAAPPPAAQVRVLPDLPPRPHALRRRGVEGVTEAWPWPDASLFEGGFSVRPDPADAGLRFQRVERRVLWTPTAGQADRREASFVTYSLRRPSGMTATVAPFPLGVDVLASLPVLDGRVRLAFAAGPDLLGRARQLQGWWEDWNAGVPLPASPALDVVYIAHQPAVVLPGGAGGATRSFSVSEDWSERRSALRAYAASTLGPNAGRPSAAAADWLSWVESTLQQGPDRSWLAGTFAGAGDDVLSVWRERLEAPAAVADPAEFLTFVAAQLPDLAVELRDRLAIRAFVLGEPDATAPWSEAPAPVALGASTLGSWSGPAALKGRWWWLPRSADGPTEGLALLGDVTEGAAWVVVPLSQEALETLAGDGTARASASAGWTVQHGPTDPQAPLSLALDGAAGLLVGAWSPSPWELGLKAVPLPKP